MEIVWILLSVLFGILTLILFVCLVSLQNSIQEVADELDEKLKTDTTTLISVASYHKEKRRAYKPFEIKIDA